MLFILFILSVVLDKLKEENPDLIVTDIIMPLVNGLELCRAVKENVRWGFE